MRWDRVSVVVVAVLLAAGSLSGCGSAAGSGTITGQLVRVGGPYPGSPVGIAGSVLVKDDSSGSVVRTIQTGGQGEFSFRVGPGTYVLSHTYPLELAPCVSSPISVISGSTVTATVVCSVP